MKDSGKVFLGLLAGVAIGATLGILFAPDSGDETRKKIASKKAEFGEDLEARFDDFLDDLKEKFSAVKQEAQQKTEEAKTAAEKTASNYSTAS